MCRILAYLGPELPLESLLLEPSNSLVKQSKAPEHHPLMQLAGWGFGAWSETYAHPDRPLLYRRPIPAFFDDNARNIIPSLRAHTALAHVRAATYRSETVMADENCHPFSFQETPWIMIHNGSVPHWRTLQRELLVHCKDSYVKQMRGTTDTEFVYTLLMSVLKGDSTDDFQEAFETVLKMIIQAMKDCDVLKSTKLKLALASPDTVIAVNFGSGFQGETDIQGDWQELRKTEVGCPDFLISTILEPLYILTGQDFQKYDNSYDMDPCQDCQPTTAILASEPLTANKESWTGLPFGCMIRLDRVDGHIEQEVRKLNL